MCDKSKKNVEQNRAEQKKKDENGLLLVIAAAYLLSGVFYISKNKNYIKCDKTEKYHEYFQVYNYYDKTIAEKGQPKKEFMAEVKLREYTLHSWLVYYEGLILDFDYKEETHRGRRLFNFQIMDDRYSLGWQKVRVGDVRSRIERIFRYSRSELKENVPIFDEEGNVTYEAVTFYYSDNFNWGYGFVYDEQDEVKTILVRPLGM